MAKKKSGGTPRKGDNSVSPGSQLSQTDIYTKLDRAAKLEQQLSSLSATNGAESAASGIRVNLCELLSDIMLTDCSFSLRKDVSGRMWRHCFYGRIGELRARISKDRGRVRKLQKNGTTAGQDLDALNGRMKNSENNLKQFIIEAVKLYNYLIDQLQGRLLPHLTCKTQSQSQSSQESTSSKTRENIDPGVVPTLHKLFIHLGDLHRYSNAYSASEEAYLKASYLAPGKGNPYNQLAVIAQLKESAGSHPLPAVALYWYCRSLLAVHDSFETSRSNLERLLVANKNWIKQNVRVGDSGNEILNTTGMNKEQTRVAKASASRKFLSWFVDYHGVLFAARISNSKFDTSKKLMATSNDLQKLMTLMTTLLTKSAFSDGLLLKMVSVNAFSVWNGLSSKKKSPDTDGNAITLALAMTFRFGAQLAQHVGVFVEKAEAKQNGESGGCTSIRLLGPLLLLCEFMSDVSVSKETKDVVDDLESQSTELLQDSEREFWSNIAELATVCKKSALVSKLLMEKQAVVRDDSISLPSDLKPFVTGYAPFACLQNNNVWTSNEKGNDNTCEYVTPDAAVEALELHIEPQSQSHANSSQRSKKSTFSTERNPNKSPADTRLKLSRFMAFISKHIATGDLVQTDDGIEWGSHSDLAESNDDKTTGLDVELDSRDEKDSFGRNENRGEEEDVLVYKTSQSGKPALLVPTALLHDCGMDEQKEDELLERSTRLLERTYSQVQPKDLVKNDLNLLAPSSFHMQRSNPSTEKEVETYQSPQHDRKDFPLPLLNQPMPQSVPVPLKPPPGFSAPALLPTLPIADSGMRNIQDENSFLSTPFRSGGIFKSDNLRTSNEQSMSALPTLTTGNDQRHLEGLAPLPSVPPNATRIPQTMNPFYLPPMSSENGPRIGISNSIGFSPPTSQRFNHGQQIQQSASLLPPPYNTAFQNNMNSDQNAMDVDIDAFDQHDMFGLRSLGIFGDDNYSKDSSELRNFNSQTQGSNQLPQTQNPFVFR